MIDRQEMEAVIEAVLFASNEPVSRDRLLEVFDELDRVEARRAVDAVVERYRSAPERGIMVDEVAGGIRLVTRPELHPYLRRFFELSGSNKLTMPALETLAIVAYRQPITGPEIQELRGVSSSGVLKTLLERRLVRIAGRKEVVGKPFLYATTREFLMHFGLRTLKELPPLEQMEELFGPDADAQLGLGPDLEEEMQREAATVAERDDDAADEATASEAEAPEASEPEEPVDAEDDDEAEDDAELAEGESEAEAEAYEAVETAVAADALADNDDDADAYDDGGDGDDGDEEDQAAALVGVEETR